MHADKIHRPSARPRLRAAVPIGVLAILLSGCATNQGDPASDPSPTATSAAAAASTTALDGVSVAGRGPTDPFPGISFPIPGDARSVEIDFTCEGGARFSVELGDSMMLGQAPLSGTCDGTHLLAWPVTERTGSTFMVMVPGDVDWSASPRFSTTEFAADSTITADCETFSAIYSALNNADTGYGMYQAFDEAEWTTRVDDATAQLKVLADESRSDLADDFARLIAILSERDRVIGESLPYTAGAGDPMNDIGQTCDINQSPLIVTGEFGG